MARIHQLRIQNFRGIENFEQYFEDTNLIVLIGRGDSGKSTILKAISLVLSPAWNTTFTDADFHNLDTSKPIEIEITLRGTPEKLLTDSKFGLYKRVLRNNRIIDDILNDNDEGGLPEEDVLTIKLMVDETLQPKWYVVNGRAEQEDIEISHRDRALFDMFIVADYTDKHFSYTKLSPLYVLLKKSIDDTNAIEKKLVDVVRQAYQSIASVVSFGEFDRVAREIKTQASSLGLDIEELKTSLEYKSNAYTESNIALHNGDTPFSLYGKGTKRLLSIAIQLALVKSGGIVLIDEIEQGLESDRVRTIIKHLGQVEQGQVFLTTHSRDVVVETTFKNIYLMRKGADSLKLFEEDLQGMLRTQPEAFFSQRIILCEGATEYGIVRALDSYLQEKTGRGLSIRSIANVDTKGGNSFYQYAIWFKSKGFDVITFNDDDNREIDETKQDAQAQEITMVICDVSNSLEQQIFNDIPWDVVIELAKLASFLHGEEAVLSALDDASLKISSISKLESITDNIEKSGIRNAFGRKATKKGWYKNVTDGESLGNILISKMDTIEKDKTLYKELKTLLDWIDEQ